MPVTNKIDGFQGDQSQYTLYLEQLVISFRTQHHDCTLAQPTDHEGGVAESSALHNERGQRPPDGAQQSPASDGFRIIQWEASPAKRHKPSSSWMEKARVLVRSAPKASNWWCAVRETGIHEVMGTGSAATFMLDNKCPLPESSGSSSIVPLAPVETSLDLPGRLEVYARSAMRRETTASLALMLANFQSSFSCRLARCYTMEMVQRTGFLMWSEYALETYRRNTVFNACEPLST